MPKVKNFRVYTPIPNRLSEHRIKAVLTMEKLSELCSNEDFTMKKGTYATIESGHTLPSKMILDLLCIVLGCKAEDLYEDVDIKRINQGKV